jgi:hypothetical protein
MDELHDSIDKLFTELDHLARVVEREEAFDPENVDLALALAKRVRSRSTILIRSLAKVRDELQP